MRRLLPFLGVLLLLSATSCTSLSQLVKVTEVKNPSDAYIVFKLENKKQTKLIGNDVGDAFVSVALASDPLGRHTLETTSANADSLYRVVRVTPGSYRVWNVKSVYNPLFGKTITTTTYTLPNEFYSVFKVNAGEVVYAGDYTFGDGNRGLRVSFDLEACRQALSEKNPLMDGYQWVSFTDDRDSL